MEQILMAASPFSQVAPALLSTTAQHSPNGSDMQVQGGIINGTPFKSQRVQVISEADTVIAYTGDKSIHFSFLNFPRESGLYRIVSSGPYQQGEINILCGLFSSREEQDLYATVTVNGDQISILLPPIYLHYFYQPEQRLRLSAHITGTIY